MKILKYISIVVVLITVIGCGQQTIPVDKEPVDGTTENAKKVIDFAESKLKDIHSVSAKIISTKDSEMYGHEKTYEGTLKAEFKGKPGTMGSRWFEAKQSMKGIDKHIKGVVTKEGIKELHILKKKVVKGGEKASPSLMIAHAFSSAYGKETFYDGLKDYTKRAFYKEYPQKQNVFLEAIENINGRDCYVIQAYNPKHDKLKFRYYFGVKDGYYYGESVEVDGEDGNQISKTLIKELTINGELPTFDVDVPEDYAVEMWVPRWEQKSMGVGMPAHDWTLPNHNNEQQTLSKEYAENVILLDFWATWCGPCKAKMPFVQKMYDKYKSKGLKVISVLSGDVGHEKAAVEYIKKHKYTFDLVFGNNELSEKYKIRFLPTVMLLDKTGKIVHFRDTPGVNDNIDEKVELEDAIKKALKI